MKKSSRIRILITAALLALLGGFYLLNLQVRWVVFPWESKAHTEKEYYESGELRTETAYDARGRKSSVRTYGKDGKPQMLVENDRFDKAGNPVRSIWHNYRRTGKFAAVTYESVYDENNRMTEETGWLKDGTLYSYSTFQRDGDGNLIRQEIYDRKGGECETILIHILDSEGKPTVILRETPLTGRAYEEAYSAEGKITSLTSFLADGSTGDSCTFEYDSDGNETMISGNGYRTVTTRHGDGSSESISYSKDGQPMWGTAYDSDGKVLKNMSEYSFTDGSPEAWTEVAYDEHNCHTKETAYSADGTVKSWTLFFCNEDGETIREEEYDSQGTLTAYETTEYSPRGNPLLRCRYYPGGEMMHRWVMDDYGRYTEDIAYQRDGNKDYETLFDERGDQQQVIWYEEENRIRNIMYFRYGSYPAYRTDYYENGELKYYSTTETDDQGKPIREDVHDSSGTVIESRDLTD